MNSGTDNRQAVQDACVQALGPDLAAYIAQCRSSDHPESHLIAILHRLQTDHQYLPQDKLNAVAFLLGVPSAKVSGVASFYHFFRLEPQGRFRISVCLGTACYVKGADAVAQRLREELGITFGETSKDGLFTLEPSRCLGTCGLAPVMMVDDEVHANVTPDQIPLLLSKYIEQARAEQRQARKQAAGAH